MGGFFFGPPSEPADYLLMLSLYLDESGQESDLVVLAGFMGSEGQWKAFVPDWRKALGRRAFLHMKDIRWNSKPKRVASLLASLGPLPYAHGLQPVRASVRVSDYSDLVAPGDRMYNGYTTCLQTILTIVLQNLSKEDRLEVVLERQDRHEAQARIASRFFESFRYDKFKTADGRPKLAKLGYVPKGSTSALDPADFLAYALRETLLNPKSERAVMCLLIFGPDGLRTKAWGANVTRESARRAVTRSQAIDRGEATIVSYGGRPRYAEFAPFLLKAKSG